MIQAIPGVQQVQIHNLWLPWWGTGVMHLCYYQIITTFVCKNIKLELVSNFELDLNPQLCAHDLFTNKVNLKLNKYLKRNVINDFLLNINKI